MTEQLFLFEPDITVLRPVEVEGYRRGRVARMGGIWRVRYWNCACGKTLHHRQVVKHLNSYHFYPESFARFVYQQAKLGLPQFLPTLANLLADVQIDEYQEGSVGR